MVDIQNKLITLVKGYMNNEYGTNDFCEQFTLIFNHEFFPDDKLPIDLLLEKICYLCERYSPYEEDILLDCDFFIDEPTFYNNLKLLLHSNFHLL